ncbi:MAG: Coenzyme A disulfide reductase [Methanomassiliicoccales archaeon PtaB.Bin134]|jgi:NADH oxidase (H2O2-forming)|nr:MAG: Coenzyme A disulfide reductase [Methanomassiliicoccales archaeon PtaB.Bin134]
MARIIVVGGGAAGMTAASTAREHGADSITLITEDEHVAYSPCAIPFVIEGKIKDFASIVMHTPEFYRKERGIEVLVRTTVDQVDMDKRQVVTADGRALEYDSLVLATGGTVFVPPVEGRELRGVFPVRWISDGQAILDALPSTQQVVVAGAGVIGLEMAVALKERGKDVTVVEMFDQVVPRIMDRDMAQLVQAHCESLGIRFVMGAPLSRIVGPDSVTGVVAGGREVPCQMVIMATGVRANLRLPEQMGLEIGPLGAVRVSPSMQPYRKGRLVPNVYLAGDVVMCQSAVAAGPTMSQLGSTAVRQGRVAGIRAAGGSATFPGTASPYISVVGGLHVGGTGLSRSLSEYYGIKVAEATAKGSSRARYYPGGKAMTVKLLADATSGRLIGGQIVGGEDVTGRINWITAAVLEGIDVNAFVERMENAYCPPTSMVSDTVNAAAERLASVLRSGGKSV